jgi:putative spermidine/putrescine transport system substrate-binding protein
MTPRLARPLRVLSWKGAWGEALRAGVSQPFHNATGVAVEAVPHVGLRLPDELVGALDAGRPPPVDVVWCNTSPALRAAHRGFCESLDDAPVLAELCARARTPALDGWPIAQLYVVHYVLGYQRQRYAEPPPSWRVLEHPDRAGHIVLYPGGNGFYPVAQVLGGGALAGIPDHMEPCWATVRGLRSQLGLYSYSVTMNAAIRRGDVHLCYRALPNMLAFQAGGLEVEWTAPVEGVADTTDAMWVPRGLAPEARAAARAFIHFALSARIQDRFCQLLGALPLNRDARGRHLAFSRDRMPRDPDDLDAALHVPEAIKAAHEPAWEAIFERACPG